MIFNKFSLKCHEYEKFWGYAKLGALII